MSDALVNGLAGAGGGIIAQVLTYPLQAVSVGMRKKEDLISSCTRFHLSMSNACNHSHVEYF
jgi:hypothetical protein